MGLRGLKAFTGLQGKRSRSEIGLGLLEVLISLALIMILVLPVISLVVNVGETSVRMDYRDTAANLASKVLACARSQPTSLLGEVNMCAPGVANPPPPPAKVSFEQKLRVTGASASVEYEGELVTSWESSDSSIYVCLHAEVDLSWNVLGTTKGHSLRQASMIRCEVLPDIEVQPASLGFTGWVASKGLYFDAPPGQVSNEETLTVKVEPPEAGSGNIYVTLGDLSISGPGAADYEVSPGYANPENTCSGKTIWLATSKPPGPTSCEIEVMFSPSRGSQPGASTEDSTHAELTITGNFLAPGSSSPGELQVPLEGYVSPDLMVVKP